jgi:hypothetical protein
MRVVTVENERLALRSGRGDLPRETLRRALDGRASVSRRGVWLPMGPGWREYLVETLKTIAYALDASG